MASKTSRPREGGRARTFDDYTDSDEIQDTVVSVNPSSPSLDVGRSHLLFCSQKWKIYLLYSTFTPSKK